MSVRLSIAPVMVLAVAIGAAATTGSILSFSLTAPIELKRSDYPAFEELEWLFAKPERINSDVLDELFDVAGVQGGFVSLDLHEGLMKRAGFTSETAPDYDELEAANPFIKTINEYVRESGEENPLFVRLNRELRGGGELSSEVAAYKLKLRSALDVVPGYNGISFRGAPLKLQYDANYVDGKNVTEASFTSTSVQPSVAQRFAGEPVEGIRPTIFIIKGFSGKPVSYFSEYAQEAEVLYPNGVSFNVIKKVPSKLIRGTNYVLMEEIR